MTPRRAAAKLAAEVLRGARVTGSARTLLLDLDGTLAPFATTTDEDFFKALRGKGSSVRGRGRANRACDERARTRMKGQVMPAVTWHSRAATSFRFMDYEGLVMPTGIRAINLKEFLDVLKHIPLEVIHHHLHRTPLQHRFGVWDYPNDFAHWVAQSLEDRALAEKLAAHDPYSHRDLTDARDAIIELVENHLDQLPTVPWARPGFDFHFASGHFLELPSEREAWTIADLRDGIVQVPLSSIFFHFHEARRREPGDDADDFSRWIEAQFGPHPIAAALRGLDFYFFSLEELRRRIVGAFDDECSGGVR